MVSQKRVDTRLDGADLRRKHRRVGCRGNPRLSGMESRYAGCYTPPGPGMHGHAHMHAACAARGRPTATALLLHTVSVTAGYPAWREIRPVEIRLSVSLAASRLGWLVAGVKRLIATQRYWRVRGVPVVRYCPHGVHRISTFVARSGVVVHTLWRLSSLERPYGVAGESDTAV